MSLPETGEVYQRKRGDKGYIKVIRVTHDKHVEIKDRNGRHFVMLSTFNRYFSRVKNDEMPLTEQAWQ